MRLRLRIRPEPRALTLTDTPDPNCRSCGGKGGHTYDYGDPETGEYAGTDWAPCDCWDEDREWTLLPLPRRRPPGGYSDKPPF
jgi:hypothetical protein